MPLPAMAAPLLFGPAAGASFKVAATVALEYMPAISSVSLGAILVRHAWKSLPSWVKQDEAFRSLVADETDTNEVLSLSAIIDKIQALVAVGSEKMTEDQSIMEPSHVHSSLLCYIRLALQLRERSPKRRDEQYERILSEKGEEDEDDLAGTALPGHVQWTDIQQALDFSVWAYDQDTDELRGKLEAVDFFLVQHTLTANMPPGHVAHFVAISPEQRTLLIGVQGTSTLEDLLIDCVGRAATYEMESIPFQKGQYSISNEDILVVDDEDSPEDTASSITSSAVEVSQHDGIRIRCHEGILIAARRLADKVHDIVQQLTSQDDGGVGYKMLLCGHSLGAGVASLLAILLRSRFPWLQQNESLHVYSFACPPVLDFEAAIACAPFCTTIVNNSDVIPRSSLANLRSLVYLLNSVHGAMEEQGLSPIGPSSVMALLRHLSQGTHGDLLMTEDLVNEAMDAAQDRVGLRDSEHLYIPGRVILMYEKWDEANAGEDKSYMQGDTIAAAAAEAISKKDGNEVHVKSPTLVHACLTKGTAKPLRFIEIDGGRMVTDHTTVSYYNSVNALALRYQSGV